MVGPGPGLGIFSKIFLIFPLTFLLKTDAELLEISPKLLEKCNEDIRTISPLTSMMEEKMKKLLLFGEDGVKSSMKSRRSLSGGKTWGKREAARPRPLRHGKRAGKENLSGTDVDRKYSVLASMFDRKQFGKSWKSLSALFI